MADIYAKARASAAKKIQQRGRLVYIRQFVKSGPAHAPVYNPSDTSVYAVVASYTEEQVDGQRIKQGDVQFVLVPPFTITPDMQIIDNGIAYSIMPETVKPGDTEVISLIQGRSG